MLRTQIRSPEDALAYLTDCCLATVSSLSMKRSRGKADYERHISIAQTAVDQLISFGIDPGVTRAKKVITDW